ncbi:MAG: nicotinate-nicotinamide nucleotide adenylyltransferase [Bryobacteraceae bacterium]|nr:nicotinate-nicotinamide nucleotide adenylyltransferase [Bryobacteraceae bacterium]
MEFFRRAVGAPQRLAILAGTFHPPTVAHMALARAGLSLAEEVLLVLPRELPHKSFSGVGFPERLEMLLAAAAEEPRFSVAASRHGLFVDIARECRAAYGPATSLVFLCGRDAAERFLSWDYGRPGAVQKMLEEFELAVADRQGRYAPPPEFAGRIRRLPLDAGLDEVSATEVRRRIAAGQPWEHLVPEAVAPLVKRYYGVAAQ